MKRIFTLLLLLTGLSVAAQPFNNEWIRPAQTYYKFKVATSGLYRIPKSTLDAAGIGNAGAQFFELWRNGNKVPIYTTNASGPLASNGYIEFWGQGNDGIPDRPLYRDPSYQHTTALNLITDTAVYFLSVNTDQSGFKYSSPANDVDGSPLPIEPYFMYPAANYYRNRANLGLAFVSSEYVYSSSYDKGEFWSSTFVRPSAALTTTLTGLPVYTSGPAASLRFGAMGDARNVRTVKVSVNGTMYANAVMDTFDDLHTSVPVALSAIATGDAIVKFENTSPVGTDRYVVSYFELTYPRQFDFGNQSNFTFSLPASASGYNLRITNFNAGSQAPILFDMATGQRIETDVSVPGTIRVVLGAGGARELALASADPSNVKAITSIAPKTFKSFLDPANQGDFLIVTNKALFTGTQGNNPVEDYKNYRASAAGGGFNVQVVDIDELTDQFAFGIKKHPLSIKNFLRYARAKFGQAPKFVFIIGKGVAYTDYRGNQSAIEADKLNLVPSFGVPASDNMLSSGDATSPYPLTPIGRLSVVSGREIENYLEKVKEYENVQQNAPNTVEARHWMKNVLHVTGSSDPYLGTLLCNYMGAYRNMLKDTSFGANITSFCKASTNTVEQINSERIAKLFEEGVSILNYFGHSSSTTLEFNLDNPEDYNNQGKYPVFFVNGCNAGNFFTYSPSRLNVDETLSEKFTLAKQRGGIAFVASTHFGMVNELNVYLSSLYTILGTHQPGLTLGELMREALKGLSTALGPDNFTGRAHAEEITLHGDPALHLNELAKPDYVMEEPQVRINPAFVSVAESNVRVQARMVNNGKAVADSIVVEVKRQYPNGVTESLMRKTIEGIRYADSLTFDLPIVASRDKGLNKVIITVDADLQTDEISESNNTVTKELFIYEDEARPVYPAPYAIINKQSQKLFASTADPFSPVRDYVMEMDTTDLFNSPMKTSRTITSKGGVLEFDHGTSFMDSTVYYWRVATVPAAGNNYQWSHSSFQYINGTAEGFGQSHFYQHTRSITDRLILDSASRKWSYGQIEQHVFIRNGVFGKATNSEGDLTVTINDQINTIASACLGRSLMFNVFDPVTFKPWKNIDAFGNNLYLSGSASANCDDERHYNFEFSYLTKESRKLIMNFMDSIPNGFYVIVRSFDTDDSASYSEVWRRDTTFYGTNQSLYHSLLGAGMVSIDSVNAKKSWIFAYRKGDFSYAPGFALSQGEFDRINLTMIMTTPDTVGTMTSPVFGPARDWRNIIWSGSQLEAQANDNPSIDVIGINARNEETLLYTIGRDDKNFDLSAVNANEFPLMKLKMRNIDSVSITPYQLASWRVLYTPVPEGALAPNLYSSFRDTLEMGEPMKIGIAFKNISKYDFDSLAVKMSILDRSNVSRTINIPKQKALITGDTVSVTIDLDSKEYPEANTVYMEFNPDSAQPEQYSFNNFLYKNVFVKTDEVDPLLDVTFDGVHILNKDLVSARPHIQIRLSDDAKFLLLNDTALSSVQLRYPDGTLHAYHFDNDTLRFNPASSGSDNTATVDFYPHFTKQYNAEGDEYELIVKGRDRSGNKAGTSEYRVSFMVITKAMISNMLNYPNPFSTSTAFVFTLTGSEIPQNMKVQILTVTGKIVREVTKEELGPIHIGRNITEFKWDGTDQFGQKLGNGVYLYRFVNTLNGKRMEKYRAQGDNTDVFFNNGYGKMYLMR